MRPPGVKAGCVFKLDIVAPGVRPVDIVHKIVFCQKLSHGIIGRFQFTVELHLRKNDYVFILKAHIKSGVIF